jgi:hypothetical protein
MKVEKHVQILQHALLPTNIESLTLEENIKLSKSIGKKKLSNDKVHLKRNNRNKKFGGCNLGQWYRFTMRKFDNNSHTKPAKLDQKFIETTHEKKKALKEREHEFSSPTHTRRYFICDFPRELKENFFHGVFTRGRFPTHPQKKILKENFLLEKSIH